MLTLAAKESDSPGCSMHCPGGAVLPAVIAAADGVAFNPAGRKLRASVSAPPRHEVGFSVLPAVQGELLVQDLDGDRASGRDVLRAIDGEPEPPEVSPRQCVRDRCERSPCSPTPSSWSPPPVPWVAFAGNGLGHHITKPPKVNNAERQAQQDPDDRRGQVPGEGLQEYRRRATLAGMRETLSSTAGRGSARERGGTSNER